MIADQVISTSKYVFNFNLSNRMVADSVTPMILSYFKNQLKYSFVTDSVYKVAVDDGTIVCCVGTPYCYVILIFQIDFQPNSKNNNNNNNDNNTVSSCNNTTKLACKY